MIERGVAVMAHSVQMKKNHPIRMMIKRKKFHFVSIKGWFFLFPPTQLHFVYISTQCSISPTWNRIATVGEGKKCKQ